VSLNQTRRKIENSKVNINSGSIVINGSCIIKIENFKFKDFNNKDVFY
jgi:hypothetical protein